MSDIEHQPTARVIAILEVLAACREGMTLTEIAKAIGSSKGTISPVIQTLVKRKIILCNPDSLRYRIGIGAYCIGASYAENMTGLQFIREQMQTITDESGEICQMGILDGNQILYVAKADSEESIRIITYVGARFPANCTALGKAVLAGLQGDALRALYNDGLPRMTKNSVTDMNELERQLEQIRTSQIAMEQGESDEQINCIAVPLQKSKRIIAAISVRVPEYRYTPEKEKQIKELLIDTKKKIELYLAEHNINLLGDS